MNLKYLWLILQTILILITSKLNAQEMYTPIKSQGPVPNEIVTFTAERVKQDRAKINSQTSRANRVAESDFHLENNNFLDQLFRSGSILFGDSLSNYVQKVGDYIISKNPKFDKNIKFYVVKSSQVNAFAIYNGIIFVNIGLLSQVKNEAQLAFILTHELVHYTYKHTLNRYTEQFKLERAYDPSVNMDYSDKVNTYVKYSKEQESQADQDGLSLFFCKTDYNFEEALGVFDVLLYSDYPFENIPFDLNFLINDATYVIPDWDSSFTIKPIVVKDDEDDSKQLHPNIKKRVEALYKLMESGKYTGNKNFIVSEKEFNAVQKLARYELANLYLQDGNYDLALYHSYLMLKHFPNDQFYENVAAYALYGLAKYEGQNLLQNVFARTCNVSGEPQRMHKYLNLLSTKEMYMQAISFIYFQSKKHNDLFVRSLFEDLVKEFLSVQNANINSFREKKINENESDTSIFKELTKEEYENLTKVEKIKYDKANSEFQANLYIKKDTLVKANSNNLWKNLVNDSAFVEYYTSEYKAYNAKDNLNEEIVVKTKPVEFRTDSLIIFNPFYYKRIYSKVNPLRNEKKEDKFINALKREAEIANINAEVIDVKMLNINDINKFNDFSILNSWVQEYYRLSSDFKSSDSMSISMIPFQRMYVDELLKKYNSRYVAFTGVYSVTDFRDNIKPKAAILGILSFFYIPLPAALYYTLTPNNKTAFIFIIIDAYTGQIGYTNLKLMKGRDYKSLINSQIYNTYNEIKHNKK